ncbi:conserved hypothetical protein [Ricinus communis]|uniref:Uncharacterized protein n=1 Tax=Ricinus communis TaxID=3988 RepID=B9TBT9_RICCO|nr:conserved hypothetical protein [Ricinus communis]
MHGPLARAGSLCRSRQAGRLCPRGRGAGHLAGQRHPLHQRPGSAPANAAAEPQLAQDVADIQRRGAVRARQGHPR